MIKRKKHKPGSLVNVWNEELRFLGVGLIVRPVDQDAEWDLYQGGDWWVLMQDGETYVFMDDDIEPLSRENSKVTP